MALMPILNKPTTTEIANTLALDTIAINKQKVFQAHNLIYSNPNGKTPAEACAEFGVNGANWFGHFAALKAWVEAAQGSAIVLSYPAGISGTQANQDGSISPIAV